MELDICSSAGFLRALSIILTIINIIKLFVPLILIFIMSFQIYNLVTNPDNIKKVKDVIGKKLIAALLVFFVPTVIELVLGSINSDVDIARCYQNAESIKEDSCYDAVLKYEKYIIKKNYNEKTDEEVSQPSCIKY